MKSNIEIVDIDRLKPLELVFEMHLKNLEEMILEDGYITKPIIADRETGTILDGSHRYAFLIKHGYQTAPVQLIDYKSDDVQLGTKLKHRFNVDEKIDLTKDECLERAKLGQLLMPRTTRHFFKFRKLDFITKLNELKAGPPKSINHLIFKLSANYELEHNINYLQEIDEAISSIVSYLSELDETKRYIKTQIELIKRNKEVAFFPGKFHPPHLGHLKTILDWIPNYKKIIIGISGDIPDNPIISQEEVFNVLQDFFKKYENIEVVKFKGRLIDKTDTSGLPDFDILISGNPDVLSWGESLNIKTRHVDRSLGQLSSSYIRNLNQD